jgi:hypothetical protein
MKAKALPYPLIKKAPVIYWKTRQKPYKDQAQTNTNTTGSRPLTPLDKVHSRSENMTTVTLVDGETKAAKGANHTNTKQR